MASTFSNLKIQLMATGENSGTWGNTTNANLGTAIEQALVETATVTFASGNVTLTLTDSNSAQNARALRLNLAGTTAGARDLIVPAIQKPYIVNNGTADIITVKVTGQTGVAVPASTSMLLYNNGTDVGLAFNRVVANVVGNVTGTASNATVLQTARTIAISGNVTGTATSFDGSGNISIPVTAIDAGGITTGTLGVARGGTGASTLTNNNVILGNTTGAVKFVAPGTSANVLTSNGTAWVSQAISAGGDYIMQVFTSPGTYTKPAGLKAVKVTVVAGGGSSGALVPGNLILDGVQGGGGGGGAAIEYLDAPALPGPQPYTVGAAGNASSFGSPAFLSATAGSAGGFRPGLGGASGGAGGVGSGGQMNINGGGGMTGSTMNDRAGGGNNAFFAGGAGGSSIFSAGGQSGGGSADGRTNGSIGGSFGGGGGGGGKENNIGTDVPQKSGGAGVVIVEEFY